MNRKFENRFRPKLVVASCFFTFAALLGSATFLPSPAAAEGGSRICEEEEISLIVVVRYYERETGDKCDAMNTDSYGTPATMTIKGTGDTWEDEGYYVQRPNVFFDNPPKGHFNIDLSICENYTLWYQIEAVKNPRDVCHDMERWPGNTTRGEKKKPEVFKRPYRDEKPNWEQGLT